MKLEADLATLALDMVDFYPKGVTLYAAAISPLPFFTTLHAKAAQCSPTVP